jgi:hypothetical protein
MHGDIRTLGRAFPPLWPKPPRSIMAAPIISEGLSRCPSMAPYLPILRWTIHDRTPDFGGGIGAAAAQITASMKAALHITLKAGDLDLAVQQSISKIEI